MAKRFYQIEGKKIPSVTTILSALDKPTLVPWAAKCVTEYLDDLVAANYPPGEAIPRADIPQMLADSKKNWRKISQKALDVGTEVHKRIEEFIKDGKLPVLANLDPQVALAWEAFSAWVSDNDVEFIESEKIVWYGDSFAGTVDAIATFKGERYLIDFKSSKGFYPENGLQIGGYLLAYNACNEQNEVRKAGILRLDKLTGIPDWRDYSEHIYAYTGCFLKVVEFDRAFGKLPKKKSDFKEKEMLINVPDTKV